MKKIALLSLLLCACHFVQADPISVLKKTNQMHYLFMQGLMAGYQNTNTPAKERIVAQSTINYVNGTGIDDSTTYRYTTANQNLSAFNYTTLDYPVPSFFNDQGYENLYGRHTSPFVWADTIVVLGRAQGPFGLIGQYDLNYSNNNIAKISYEQVVAPFTADYSEINYDKDNHISSVFVLGWAGSVYDSDTRHFFAYNNGLLVADSLYANTYFGIGVAFRLEETNAYTYDNAGNLLTLTNTIFYPNAMPPSYDHRYVNTYTADNRLKTSEYDTYSGGQFQMQEVDTFGYTQGVPYCTYWKETAVSLSVPPINLSVPFIINYHTTASGTVDSVYGSVNNGGAVPSDFKIIFTYDSDDEPVNGKFYYTSGAGSSAAPAWEFRYYYQPFMPSGVETVTAATPNISVYPNPASNTVNIAGLTGNATIKVINMAGQVIATQNTNGARVQSVPLGSAIPGFYLLHITDPSGAKIYSQTIVKQ